MKVSKFIFFIASITLFSCGSGSSSVSSKDKDKEGKFELVNVALKSEGATATSITSFPDNLIDGNDTTVWTNASDIAIVVEFEELKEIVEVTLTRMPQSASLGSSPDILVQFSEDGVNYENSNMSMMFGGVPCDTSVSNSGSMHCEMNEGKSMKFIKIHSPTFTSYDFKELSAIAKKPAL